MCICLLGPFHGAIAVPSVTRCCCCCRRRCHGHRCAGGMRRATVATPGEWQCKTACSGEWAQHFSNASCFYRSAKLCGNRCSNLGLRSHSMPVVRKTLRHQAENRKNITYRNAVRGGPSHGHFACAQALNKHWSNSVLLCGC